MWDLVSLGELLIDFTPSGTSANGNPLFERNPGGGPGNMACAAAKLGARTAFIGQVGDDAFGRTLRDVVQKTGWTSAVCACRRIIRLPLLLSTSTSTATARSAFIAGMARIRCWKPHRKITLSSMTAVHFFTARC